MTKDQLIALSNNPNIYYIYQIDKTIYGLFDSNKYLVITSDTYTNRIDSETLYYTISEWFELVKKSDITAWKCACLNKKYVIKEYVKLLMTTDPVMLRINLNAQYADIINNFDNLKEIEKVDKIFDLIVNVLFSIQIIENHKIVNFKEPNEYYYKIQPDWTIDDFKEFYDNIINYFRKLTDGIWIKRLKDKARAKFNDEIQI